MGNLLLVAGVTLVLVGIGVVVVQLVRGDHGLRPMLNEDRETRRAVRRAIRVGHTDDPGIDRLARQVIRATPRHRWAKYFFGLMLILAIGLLVTSLDDIGQIIRHASQAALWVGFIVLNMVNERRLDGYRGLPDN